MARRRVIPRNGAVAAILLLALVSGGAPWPGTGWRAAAHATVVSEAEKEAEKAAAEASKPFITEFLKLSKEALTKLIGFLKAAGHLMKEELKTEGPKEFGKHLQDPIRDYLRDKAQKKGMKVPKNADVALPEALSRSREPARREQSGENGVEPTSGQGRAALEGR